MGGSGFRLARSDLDGSSSTYRDQSSGRYHIISVERLFTDYEATSHEVLIEHVMIAALRRLLPPEIKVHVNMLVKDTTTYADVKATVTEYEVAERRYAPLKEVSVYDHTSGAVPMDVDQVQASKGGKAKGNQGARVKAPKGISPRCASNAERHTRGSAGIRMENPMLVEKARGLARREKGRPLETPKEPRPNVRSVERPTMRRTNATKGTKKVTPKGRSTRSLHRRPERR